MPDIDELLSPQVSEQAERAARSGDFDAAVGRGRRRRRRSQIAVVVGSAAAVVAVVAVGAAGAGMFDAAGPDPATTPSAPSTPTADASSGPAKKLLARQIVRDPKARPIGVAISADDPSVRATLWRLCDEQSCETSRFALALTGDGFETARYVRLRHNAYPSIAAVGDAFYVSQAAFHGFLYEPDGSRAKVDVSRDHAPVAGGEILVQTADGLKSMALDPATGTGHRLPKAARRYEPLTQQVGGRLVGARVDMGSDGMPAGSSAMWSDDGGATWSERHVRTAANASPDVIESGDPQTIAMVEVGDGATLRPFGKLHYSSDGGATWQAVEPFAARGDTAYLSWAAVRPDGSLVAYMEAWSDGAGRKPSKHAYGPYESDGADWSDLRLVAPGLPDRVEGDSGSLSSVVDHAVSVDGDRLTVLVVDGRGKAYRSDDGGRTWAPAKIR